MEAKSQVIWTPEELLAELLDEANVGGAWLRCQADSWETFWALWNKSEQHPPQLSTTQSAQLAMTVIGATPGVRQARVREAVGGNRGRLDQSLAWLIDHDYVRAERVCSASGEVVSCRFWLTGKASIIEAARALGRALSLALMGWEATLKSTGHRTAGSQSTRARGDLLKDKKMRARGLRVWHTQARRRRRAARQAGREALQARQARQAPSPVVEQEPQTPQAARLEALHHDEVRAELESLVAALLADDGPPAMGQVHEDEPSAAPFAGSEYLDLIAA